jgi:dipeptidyl aminopeptidase/acylaminoacyl peptidase
MNTLLNLNLDSFLFSFPDESTIVQQLFKPPQIFTFFTNDNCKLYGMVYMPFNYEHGLKYPTVLYVYGGPKAQLVTNSYKANK